MYALVLQYVNQMSFVKVVVDFYFPKDVFSFQNAAKHDKWWRL